MQDIILLCICAVFAFLRSACVTWFIEVDHVVPRVSDVVRRSKAIRLGRYRLFKWIGYVLLVMIAALMFQFGFSSQRPIIASYLGIALFILAQCISRFVPPSIRGMRNVRKDKKAFWYSVMMRFQLYCGSFFLAGIIIMVITGRYVFK